MTVAPQGELTLQVNKLASCHVPVAAVMGPGQPFVISGIEEIAACDLTMARPQTRCCARGVSQPGGHLPRPRLPAPRRLRHGGRAGMRVHTTQRLYPTDLSPSLWPS
jgi:hypothetical protein